MSFYKTSSPSNAKEKLLNSFGVKDGMMALLRLKDSNFKKYEKLLNTTKSLAPFLHNLSLLSKENLTQHLDYALQISSSKKHLFLVIL